MRITSLVSKLKLKDQWSLLQTNPSTQLLEEFLLTIIKHLEKEKLILIWHDRNQIVYTYPEFNYVLEQVFKQVSPHYGLEAKSPIIKEICEGYSLSLEAKIGVAARAFGWFDSLDDLLEPLEEQSDLQKRILNVLDSFLLKESLATCLLSESRFVRERGLHLKNNLKKKRKKSS